MSAVIEILCFSDGRSLGMKGKAWVMEFSEEEGLIVTNRMQDAKRFEEKGEAWDFYRQEFPQGVLGQNPGGPNRPLTAFTVMIYDPKEVRP
jgi:hypothetical protein